jgi:hypothetical protein
MKKIANSLSLLGIFASQVIAQSGDVALTVYNRDLALVKEVRELQLASGVSEIKFQDIPARIDPTSVYFNSLTAPEKVTLLEQNYEFDLVNSEKILQKYLDEEIRIETKDGLSYSGILLNSSSKDLILQEKEGGIKIIQKNTVENLAFPELPAGLITRPTLVWRLDCRRPGKHQIEVGYLTRGMQWHAEYVAIVNETDSALQLRGWVSLENHSGATFTDAKLKLVAGDINRVKEVGLHSYASQGLARAAPHQLEEKSFFDYHLYTLQRPATVANNQIKQVSLFEPAPVTAQKSYFYDGARDGGKVRVGLNFINSEKSGLGMPLPGGKIRVYKRDDDSSLVLLGEDLLEHSPVDEKIDVFVGYAFDIVGERRQMNRNAMGKTSWEETWMIKLRNHRAEKVNITVIERFDYDWEIVKQSHAYEKKDVRTIHFVIPIESRAETVVQFTVEKNRR